MEKFKPILELNKLGNKIPKIICNRLLEPIDAHPIVVFYDDFNEEIWYIKGRSAIDSQGNFKKVYDGEILIKGNQGNKGIFKKDTLLDCSQIFKMDVSVFNQIVDKKSQLFLNTQTLELKDIKQICDKIYEITSGEEPMLSVIHVDIDLKNNISTFIPMYANIEILDEKERTVWEDFEYYYEAKKISIIQNDERWNEEKWESPTHYIRDYLLDNLHYSMNRIYQEQKQNKSMKM